MSEKKEEIKKNVTNEKIFAEARGRYTKVEGNKVFHFSFPAHTKLGENYDVLSEMREAVWEALEHQKKLEKDKEKEKVTEEKKDLKK